MAKQNIKKSHVYIQTSKGLFPYDLLQKAEVKDNSTQLAAVQKWMTQNDLIKPPYSPMSLLMLWESNPVFFRCVSQLAIDVAGLGWNFQLQEDKKEDKAELVRLNEFTKHPNKDESFRSILKKLLTDWGTIGYCGLEIGRNRIGEIGEIWHVPAHTLSVHKDKKKYAQSRNNKRVWFKKFGEGKNISRKTGKEIAGSRDKANELIFYKNYYPLSDYYGVPNIISAVGDIMGMIGLRDYNLAFFENYGIPAAVVVLEGDWDTGSEKKVSDFINKEIKGSTNAHRTLVVTQAKDDKITWTPLNVEAKESSFKLYEKARQENILIAYSMPPERIGIRIVGKLGGNVAEEATKIYVQGVVEPLQLDFEDIINEKLLQSETYKLKFTDIDTRDYDKLVNRLIKQVASAIITPNEARNKLGLKPYLEGDKFFVSSNLVPAGEMDDDMKLAKEIEDLITKG